MNSKERILSCLKRTGGDRLPVTYWAVDQINAALAEKLGCAIRDLPQALGTDIRTVLPKYCGPEMRSFPDGTREGLWGELYSNQHQQSGFFQELVHQPFAGITDLTELAKLRQPSADWFDYSNVKADCLRQMDKAIAVEDAGSLDFLNGIGRCRGQEQVLYDVATADPVFLALVEQRFAFFYEKAERTLKAADGLVDIVMAGEDLGTQAGPMISPDSFDRLFAEKFRAYFELAHRHGAKTMMHSCGAISAFIPRLIDLGLDILDVVQVSCPGMELAGLQRNFGKDLVFSGTMCVQTLLPRGTVADIRREVELRKRLFGEGGLILGPTNSIELGTPIENIMAMYDCAGSLS